MQHGIGLLLFFQIAGFFSGFALQTSRFMVRVMHLCHSLMQPPVFGGQRIKQAPVGRHPLQQQRRGAQFCQQGLLVGI